ncbi:unnamed protein product [Coregonus sp. 'balchen']|nr:unnamed protein product [Coregonus sp. 'balchen']
MYFPQQRRGLEEMTGPVCGVRSPHTQRDDIQNIIQRIKSAELAHLLHAHYPERDSVGCCAVETLERPYPHSQQPQASIKQQLVNVLKELELQRALWEDRQEKVAEQRRLQEQQEQKQKPQAKRAAVVNWWRTLKVEGSRTKAQPEDTLTQPSQALTETESKLQQAEHTITKIREQVCHLEAALRTAQEDVAEHKNIQDRVGVLHKDKETNTVREGPGWAGEEASKERKDVAVATDPVEDPGRSEKVAAQLLTSEGLLVTLRRMEAMVSSALEAAELVRESQRRVSQVKERMESITQKMEEALTRAVDTEGQLSALEARVTAKPQLPGPIGQTAQPDVEAVGRDRPRNPSPPEPVSDSYSKSRWPLISGAIYSQTGGGSNSGSKSCDDSEAPCNDDNKPSQVQCPDFVPDQKHNSSIPVSETQTPPVSPSQVFLQYECAPPLTVPPETPPQSACDSHAAAHTEENVAGTEDPCCRDYCQSETRDCGSGQALPPGDCGRSQPSDSGYSAGSKASEPEDSGRSNKLEPTDIGCDLEHCGSFHSRDLPTVLITCLDKEGGGHELYCFPWVQTEQQLEESPTQPIPAESPFFFPLTRPRPPQPPVMPVLPEEEEDSPEELDSSSSSPSTYTPVESRAVTMAMPAPTIVFPKQASVTVFQADGRPLEQTRPHSPRPCLSRNSLGGPITTVDSTGNVIDLVKDRLPELQLSEEDRQKNLELLQEAKKVSDRFLSRRGRKSTCSLSESPTGLSPNHTPSSSPVPSRSTSLITAPQIAVATEVNYAPSSPVSLRLEVLSEREQADTSTLEHESTRRLVDWKPNEKRKVSSGTLAPRYSGPPPPREPSGGQKENCDPRVTAKNCLAPVLVNKPEEGLVRAPNQAPATGVAKPVPRPPTQQAPCTAEIKTIGAFPPLMRAVSWDTVGTLNSRNGAPSLPPTNEETISFQDKTQDALLKSSGYKDFPVQPVNVQKLSKIREEHKLMRNQSIVGSKLADLSETAEQERGSPTDEEAKEKSDAMPNISDIMLRKLKLHRGLPGCAPPLTEKEVENAFVQLSLAFRNDNYTLETRLKQAERERTLTEENTEKELEEFKGSLKCTAPQWSNMDQRESYQSLIETVAVLHRLATRLSSRAEMVGAVRQRTYEKDHAELMEFKKLANQNSSRCYGGSIDTGDDGVPRPSRSMSLTLGKALPRRRVSVAVVPKFNLLNIPGQTPVMAGPGPSVAMGPSHQPTMGQALPVLCEANSMKSIFPTQPTQPAIAESGKSVAEQEAEPSAPAKPPVNLEEIRSEIKAKIEEEAYNKGYQEGLKRSKEVKEVVEEEEEEEEEENAEELPEKKDEEKGKEVSRKEKFSSKVEEILVVLDRLCPKIFRRNRLLWIVLTLFLVTFLVVNVFTYFSDRYNNHGDMSAEKAMVQGKKKIFGLNVGVQPKNPTPE